MRKRLAVLAVMVLGLIGGMVGTASALTNVDSWGPGTLNGCQVDSVGYNSQGTNGSYGAGVSLHSDTNCGVTECIRLSYTDSGGAHWAGEACDNGSLGATTGSSVGPCSAGNPCSYLGRQIRIGASCYWDTVFDNPTPHACI
jgi:hypothetical protein